MLPLPPTSMPMKVAADDASGAPPLNLPPLPMPPEGAMPPPSAPPAMPPLPSAPAPMPPNPMPPMGAGPAPMAPMPGPIDPSAIQTRTQDDGTIVGYVPLPDGSEHIVGVHPPFKLPKGQKPAAGAPPMDLSRAALPPQ
jgi:hypothetical protein